jgi:hypothetical protein
LQDENMKKHKASIEKTRAPAPDPVDRILDAADLKWSVLKAPIAFKPEPNEPTQPIEVDGHAVLFRSDNKEKLAIVSSSHQPWQPREIIDFYLNLSAFYGLAFESVGYVQGGRKLWGLLNTGQKSTFSRGRTASTYLLLSTSYDSMLAAQATSLCILEPGALALPAAPGKPLVARIARSPEFLTPVDLAGIGELMCECISFPGFLQDLAGHTPSEAQIKQATAAALGSRGEDPITPSAKALRTVVAALRESNPAAKTTTSLDLLYALAGISDAREQRRRPEDVIHNTWFGVGAKRKQFAVRALARIFRPY